MRGTVKWKTTGNPKDSPSRTRPTLHARPIIQALFIVMHCSVESKVPVTFTEVGYDWKPVSLVAKFDTEGKSSVDIKMKTLADGLTVTKK